MGHPSEPRWYAQQMRAEANRECYEPDLDLRPTTTVCENEPGRRNHADDHTNQGATHHDHDHD